MPENRVKLFDAGSRPVDDSCAVEARDMFNQGGFEYRVQNYRDTPHEDLVDFASEQHNLRFQDGYGTPSGSAIEESSKLRHDFGWRARGKEPTHARTFHAAPDMSRGRPNPEAESKILHVPYDLTTRQISETDYHRFVPLIPSLQESVQDVEHIVPEAWVPGGEDSRGKLRDPEYLRRNGFEQDPATGAWARAKRA